MCLGNNKVRITCSGGDTLSTLTQTAQATNPTPSAPIAMSLQTELTGRYTINLAKQSMSINKRCGDANAIIIPFACMIWLFAETQQEMRLLASDWLATPAVSNIEMIINLSRNYNEIWFKSKIYRNFIPVCCNHYYLNAQN